MRQFFQPWHVPRWGRLVAWPRIEHGGDTGGAEGGVDERVGETAARNRLGDRGRGRADAFMSAGGLPGSSMRDIRSKTHGVVSEKPETGSPWQKAEAREGARGG